MNGSEEEDNGTCLPLLSKLIFQVSKFRRIIYTWKRFILSNFSDVIYDTFDVKIYDPIPFSLF